MSALRQYQIKEVLKIHKAYIKNNKSRNLLLSVEDFGHILKMLLILTKSFNGFDDDRKDYLAKTRFNVIIARPKNYLFEFLQGFPTNTYQFIGQNTLKHLHILVL